METLVSVGLSNAVLVVGLAVVVWVLAWLCRRRPAVVHVLWLLVLLRFLLPPLWTLSLPRAVISEPLAVPEREAIDVDALLAALPKEPRPAKQEPAPAQVAEATPALPAEPVERSASRWTERGVMLLLGTWLVGAVFWWLLATVRLARFHSRLRAARLAPPAIQEQARQLARRMGLKRCPRVWLVQAAISPLLLALGPRPRLLLPAQLWQRLTAEQQDTVLVHELAHLRRGDPWVRRLELIVLGLYWWHPVAWWAQRQLHEAEEQCCDRWVLKVLPGAAASYATTLVETMAYLSGCRSSVPRAASGLGQVDSLKRRLTMILRDDSVRPLPRSALVVLGLILLCVPLLPGWAEPPRHPAGSVSEGRGGDDSPASDSSPSRAGSLTGTLIGPSPAETAPSVEDLKDEIEVLKVQLAQAEADVKGKQAYLEYRTKQHHRISELVRRGAIEERLEAEERDRRDAALAACDAARGQVVVLKTKLRIAEGRLARRQGQGGQALQELRDSVELLEAQVQIRQAELKAAEKARDTADRQLKRYRDLAASGAIDQRVLENQQARQETTQAEVEVRKAALLEPAIRLKQARRRLAALESGKKPPSDSRPAPGTSKAPAGADGKKDPPRLPAGDKAQAERMRELEKKLNDIAEELKTLRRNMDGNKAPPVGPGSSK